MNSDELDAWADRVDGERLDLDGAFPGECHDVFLSYLYELGGAAGDGHAPGIGYTDGVYRQFPSYRPGLARIFTKHGAESIRRGDVVFWAAYGGVGGLPHVAVALAGAANGKVLAVTQNPGPTKVAELSLAGVLGVLRPIHFTPNTHTEGDTDMTPEQDRKLTYIFDTLTAGQAGVKHQGEIHKLLHKMPESTADAVLNRRIPRQGGAQKGETTLGATVAWLDGTLSKLLSGIAALAGKK